MKANFDVEGRMLWLPSTNNKEKKFQRLFCGTDYNLENNQEILFLLSILNEVSVK